MRKSRYRGTYETYERNFQQSKANGLVLHGVRQLTRKQWANEISQGMTNTAIINNQTMSKKAAQRAYKQYQKLMKDTRLNPGEVAIELEKTYWGHNNKDKNAKIIYRELGYHRTFSGFMKDKHAVHMMISFEIKLGERSREEILDDYGYHD